MLRYEKIVHGMIAGTGHFKSEHHICINISTMFIMPSGFFYPDHYTIISAANTWSLCHLQMPCFAAIGSIYANAGATSAAARHRRLL